MRHFNFNNSTKNAISRLSFAFSIIACILFTGTAWGQAKVTVGSDISATGSMVLEVSGVDDASVSATPVERTSPNGLQLYCAYDIDITKDGREWQPEPNEPAIVTMEGANFADGQMLDIYHEGANGLEFVATVAAENGKIVFPAPSFSVYIVAQSGDYARLKVTFHRADGRNVTIYVKAADLEPDVDHSSRQGGFNTIVFNPGMGTPADGVDCMGWMDNELYDAVDIPYAMTFDDIRTYIAGRLNDGVEDGTTVDFYAMLFKHYSVTYLAENGSVLQTNVISYRANVDSPTLNYFVNESYTPASSTQNFEGWMVNSESDGDHIVGHTNDLRNYSNNTEIGITGDVSFRVNVSEGHWLVYHENGKGATYKAADFVRAGEVTVEPNRDDMMRFGYTFDDWYESDAEGNIRSLTPFDFGHELDDNKHVAANWFANTTAPYSVIVWKQNINCDGYDFDAIISLTGDVGTDINTVSSSGSDNARSAIINGNNYSGTIITGHDYTGFHLDHFDQNVEIKTEGNAVLNVYYNRNRHTLTFKDHPYNTTTSNNDTQYGLVDGQYVVLTRHNSGSWYNPNYYWTYGSNISYTGTRYTRGNGWVTVKEIEAGYGQSIGINFPINGTNGAVYDNGERWDPQSTPSNANDIIVYIDVMPDKDETYNWNVPTDSRPLKTMNYYLEVLPGETGVLAPNNLYDYNNTQISSGGRRFVLYKTIGARYNWVTKAEDFFVLVGCDRLGVDQQETAVDEDDRGYCYGSSDCTVSFYYTRKHYTINFMNGAKFDGDNNNLETDGRTQIETVSNIAYGADVSSYNDYTPDPASAPEGYVFEGWYADETCTQPFSFATMTEGGITVYAKWRQIQYRVFLHPNVDEEDISLYWGSANQAMNFRRSYGEKISTPTGTRADYEFVGWYTDEQFRHAFNESTPMNETTVTTPYNKTADMTDNMNKWGKIERDSPYPDGTSGPGYNSDSYKYENGTFSIRNRFWITKKFDLYAKWHAILRGAIGIEVEYDAGDGGDNAPTDSKLYQDQAYAIAGHASSHGTKEFSHWVLLHYNPSTGAYEETRTNIYPGATFAVLKRDAKMHDAAWYNSNNERYTGGSFDIEGITPPHDDYKIFRATYTVKLRAEYITKEEPTYTSIQWFMNDGNATNHIDGESPALGINEAVVPQVPTRAGYIFKGWYKDENVTGTPEATYDGGCEPNFLFYNNNKFYKEAAYTTEVTAVAADNYNPTDYLYAIWEPIVEFDIAPICKGDQIVLSTTTKYGVDLSRGSWSWTVPAGSGSISGSTYTASTDATSVTLTFRPDYSETCAHETGIPVSIQALDLSVSDDFDYIWKGGAASSETDWNTASNWYVYNRSNHIYSVASVPPETSKNIYVGEYNCKANMDPEVGSAEAYAKNITIASGASLTVPDGKTLNIAGNLDIAAGAAFLADDNSKVVFNGSSDQSVNRPVTFWDVKFAQNGGVHTITIPENMTVNGVATFDKGIANADVIFNDGASAVFANGARYNSYVSGIVTKKGNSDSFTFPLGDDGVLGSFTTKIIDNTDKGVAIKFNHKRDNEGHGFSIEEYPRWWNINDMCPGSAALPSFDHVSNYEYWEVVDISEETSLSEITLKVDANDQLEHFNRYFSGRENDIIYAAAHFDCWKNIGGPAEPLENNNQTITVNVQSISRSRSGNFDGIITLGSIDHNTVLPIELTSFSATCDGRSSLVEWTTATEKNNDYFSLERSDDAINFVEIARIAGAGNSIEPLSYSYTDYGVYGGDNYYRLVQVDYDGTRTASEIIVTNCVEASGEPEVLAYPNPFNSDLTVELENFGDRPASIEVYDLLGRLVYVEKADAPQNNYQTILHLDGLSNSTYTVRVSTADFVINRKVVKD